MNLAIDVKSILSNDICDIIRNSESFVNNPGKDFTRNRKISMHNLMEFYLSMESGNLQHELLKFFQYNSKTASVSAFLQQLNKLKPEVFLHLLKKFNCNFDYKKYKEKYRLIACDGSEFNIPLNEKDSDSYFEPSVKSKRGFNMLYVIPLYDILNRRYLDVELQPIRRKNEFRALCNLMDRFEPTLKQNTIFVADRGFCSYNVFANALENKSYFLIRAKDVYVSNLLKQEIDKLEEFQAWLDASKCR